MTPRMVCLDCKAVVSKHPSSRCPTCKRSRDAARGTRQQRGYGRVYDADRRSYQQRMDAGSVFFCWRCAALGKPHMVDPSRWNLGHCDDNREVIHGPECAAGNLATSGRTRCTHPSHA